jgi:DNA repair protein RecO (recombination protein O)
LARSIKAKKNRLAGLLQVLQPLSFSWYQQEGKSIRFLHELESKAKAIVLRGQCLYCAFYLNELLLRLLPLAEEANSILAYYEQTLLALAEKKEEKESLLREFEGILLDHLGYGLNLQEDSEGNPIQSEGYYGYKIEQGFYLLSKNDPKPSLVLLGKSLYDIAQKQWNDPYSCLQAKHLYRFVLRHYLGDRPLKSRLFFQQMQAAKGTLHHV